MAKLIAAINMTLDGYCDHTVMTGADDELHVHFTKLLKSAGVILYGRITFQLMEYWRSVLENPTGNKSTDEFAVTIDKVPKIVFSRTLEGVDWKGTELKREIIREEILELKRNCERPVFAGSPSLIVSLGNMGLIDEYQIVVHPVVVGKGLPLFKNLQDRMDLKLLGTERFGSGTMVLNYARATN